MVSDLFANSLVNDLGLTMAFSPAMEKAMERLRAYLREKVYSHPSLTAELAKGEELLRLIHQRLLTDDSLIGYLEMELAAFDRYQAAADFIAGMTDRYALSFGQFLKDGSWPGPLERALI
jgi:dGTPase